MSPVTPRLRNIIQVGAGGTLGVHVLKALLADGSFNVTVLTRSESKSTFPPEVRLHRCDYSPASLEDAFRGQDAVVSTVGSQALAAQIPMVDAAVKAGVKRFIPSEMGSNTDDAGFRNLTSELNGKRDIIEKLIEREGDGLTWTGLVTGGFYDWCLESGLLGFELRNATALLIDGGTAPLRLTTLPTVGRAVVGVLKHPDTTVNRYVEVASFEISQTEVLAVLSRVSGKTFKVEYVSAAEKRRIGLEKMSKEPKGKSHDVLQGGFKDLLQGTVIAGLDKHGPIENELIGLTEREDLDEVTERILNGTYK